MRHAGAQGREDGAENVASGLAGEPHEFEFVRGLDGSAADRDGIGGSAFEGRRGGTEMVEECEERGFVNGDATSAEAAIGERLSGEFGWALVFLPHADFSREAKLFAKSALFKRGTDEKRPAGARQKQREEPFARPPANAGEVVERSSRRNEERVEFWREIRHQLLCPREASTEFIVGDRNDAGAKGLQRGESGRQRRRVLLQRRFAGKQRS